MGDLALMAHVPVSAGVLDSIQVTPDPLAKVVSLALPPGVLALGGDPGQAQGWLSDATIDRDCALTQLHTETPAFSFRC